MKPRITPLTLIALSLSCALMQVSCTTSNRDKWLRVFFDGVPPLDSGTEAGEDANVAGAERQAGARKLRLKPRSIIHEPYAERECAACHASSFSQSLKGSALEVCSGCHGSVVKDLKHVHSPVEEGECAECHDPHKGGNLVLLKKPPRKLCFECHDDDTEGFVSRHRPVVSGDCASCHDGHGSNNKAMTLAAGKELCFGCHGVELERPTLDDKTRQAVFSAVRRNDTASLRVLFDRSGKDAANCRIMSNVSPLHLAAALDYPIVAKMLIDEGARLESRTDLGFTPLHWAASRNSTNTVSVLIAAGANLSARAYDFTTPSIYAFEKDAKETSIIFAKAAAASKVSAPASASFDDLSSAKFRHSPAEEGECGECHDPHKSENAHLLKHAGSKLCYECHEDEVAEAKVKHSPVEEGECGECHDPHKSENAGLLKKAGAKLCYECHDDEVSEAKVKHSPVEEGECGS